MFGIVGVPVVPIAFAAQRDGHFRSYLPAATLTNVGFFGVGQAFEYLLSKLHSHELSEAKELAAAMHGELMQLIPSFVKRVKNERLPQRNIGDGPGGSRPLKH